MIKEKLMRALKSAAEDYNGGMGINAAVAKAAEAADFNEKQAERLVEMVNTAIAINKEKDKSDPTGSCELASKEAVAKLLLDGCTNEKEADAKEMDYSFYKEDPLKTNPSIEARSAGRITLVKSASSECEVIPSELNVSQRSLYKIIEGKIDMLKSAAASADDVVRNLKLEIDRNAVKIAKAIEDPFANPEIADMFKAACESKFAIDLVSEYSTKVADSNGGKFSKWNVFDSPEVDDLLKIAASMDADNKSISEYEGKRDFYMSKAAEAESEMKSAVGLLGHEKQSSIADFFDSRHVVIDKKAACRSDKPECISEDLADASMSTKLASMIIESGVSADEVGRLAEDFEKDAAFSTNMIIPMPNIQEAHGAFVSTPGVDSEKKRLMNVRRSIILADLMTNDPIIRDADPNMVTEAYKTMVMTSPRVSLDKAQVRAFLRSSVNSVAISPVDAKVIADVDKGMALSNVDRLTARDSSIKDSNT